MEKKVMRVIAIVIVGIFVLTIIKNFAIQTIVNIGATQTLGAPVRVGGLSLGIFTQRVVIKNLEVYNPKGFGPGKLLDIPLIDVKYDLSDILGGKLHLPYVNVDLQQMLVVRDKQGKLNVDSLKVAQSQTREKKPLKKETGFQIDYLKLNIGQIVYRDFSQGEKPVVQVFKVNLKNREYRNLNSPQQFASLVLVEGMKPAAIKGAQIYGVATLAGMAFLPVGVAAMFSGSDSATADFNVNYDKAFSVSAEVFKQMGALQSQDKAAGTLGGALSDCDTRIKIEKTKDNAVKITVSARKFMMPKPEIAAGVLYEITQKLKS